MNGTSVTKFVVRKPLCNFLMGNVTKTPLREDGLIKQERLTELNLRIELH